MNQIILYADQILLFCRELKEEIGKFDPEPVLNEMDIGLVQRNIESIERAAHKAFDIASGNEDDD